MVGQPAVPTVSDYVAVVRRRFWIVVVAAVAVAAAAYAYSRSQPTVYAASARVLVAQQRLPAQLSVFAPQQPANSQTAERAVTNAAELASATAILQRTLDAADIPGLTFGRLRKEASVTPSRDADFLTFTIQDRSASVAATLANEYARQFGQYQQQVQAQIIRRATSSVNKRIARLRSEIVKHPRRLVADRAELGFLTQSAQQLQTYAAVQTSNTFLVQAATQGTPVQPKTRRNVLAGLGAGAVIGLLIAFLRDATDRRVRNSNQAREWLGLPLLARIPADKSGIFRRRRGISMRSDPGGAQAEAYRLLRTNFGFANIAANNRIVMVTSALDREGKTTTCANLAVACAQGGARVVLLDLDLRRPRLHEMFGLARDQGATDVLAGTVDLHQALHRVDVVVDEPDPMLGGELRVLTAGTPVARPADRLETEALISMLRGIAQNCDLVLVDSAPLLPVSDASAVAGKVDGVIVVIAQDRHDERTLTELRRSLDRLPVAAMGFVATGVSVREEAGYTYASYHAGASGR
jgi:polysaccharide biosynthesis transport protein